MALLMPLDPCDGVASPTGGFQHVGQTDFLTPATGALSNLTVELIPSVFDKLETGFQTHGTGEIANFRKLFFNLEEGLDDFLQPFLNTEEAIDPLLHHRIDGELEAFLGFGAQGIDPSSHPVLKLDEFAL